MSALDDLLSGLDGALERGLDELLERAASVARTHASAELGRSVKVRRAGVLARALTADNGGAAFVEAGRRTVYGRPVLHFVVAGKDVFATRVGPARARPFMAPARRVLERQGPSTIEASLRGILR